MVLAFSLLLSSPGSSRPGMQSEEPGGLFEPAIPRASAGWPRLSESSFGQDKSDSFAPEFVGGFAMAGEESPLSPRTMAGKMAMSQAKEDMAGGRDQDAEMSILAAISLFEEAGNAELLEHAQSMLEYVHQVIGFDAVQASFFSMTSCNCRGNIDNDDDADDDDVMVLEDTVEHDTSGTSVRSPEGLMGDDITVRDHTCCLRFPDEAFSKNAIKSFMDDRRSTVQRNGQVVCPL
eukprot:755040-Hanusia_phi.AAC.4